MKDVASLAGAAVGTVSNVLNHPELVRPQTRARVEAAMEQLGFIPNASARQLRAGRGSCLGLVVLDVRNPFFTEVARGVEDCAQAQGYAVILCNSDEAEDKERHYLRVLEEQRVRGILITPVHGSAPAIKGIRDRGTPWSCRPGPARPVTARWPWTTGAAVNWPSPTCWPSATGGSPWSTGRWPSASAPTAGAAPTTR
jgi:DNA-binding LacI/PurR family transcriptional regulator